MEQNYSNYTDEDRKVWKVLFDRQIDNLSKISSQEYLDGLTRIDFNADKIPNFENTEQRLQNYTCWKLHVVPSIIPVKDFFELLIKKQFPATTWLRKMTELDYLEEPDMFHDVFGHVPLLTNDAYTGFFLGIAEISVKHLDNEYAQELLGRVYWFTIEFGLIRENGNVKAYGAGLMSSLGESKYSMTNEPQKFDFDVKTILNTSFRTDIFQDKYFIIDSYEQLYNCVPEIEKELDAMLQLQS
ncbi:MAG: phenylalanine 4-monooxygenase [Bacteroidia bacterium]|nr:phenylalanine 4-monooxygenase [Bacteroidia bacterium]